MEGDDERPASRAEGAPPEEGGTDDSQAQSEAVLAESDERTYGRRDPDERRTSDEATPPADEPGTPV
jgi:hypothetical protein